MSYKHDVFLSYRGAPIQREWVRDVFYPLFEDYLREALNKEVDIFIDTDDIKGGDSWKKRIPHALCHSRILVSILVPTYFGSEDFESEWCKKEFALMDHRQRECGFGTLEKPDGLILPLKIQDGDLFPEYAKSLQIFDCNQYFLSPSAFKNSQRYNEFQDALKAWVERVAAAHLNAPEWDAKWHSQEHIDAAWNNLDYLTGSTNKKAPTL